jgi:hypothetical protein
MGYITSIVPSTVGFLIPGIPKVPMIFVVDTNEAGSANDHFILPLNAAGTYSFTVDWGDSSQDVITTFNDPALDHTYTSPGIFNVSITGICSYIYFNNTGDNQKITDITQWGDIAFDNFENSFHSCSNLVGTYTDKPNMNAVINMKQGFSNCSLFTGTMDNWDVSNVTNMQTLFSDCLVFDSPLNSWNTGEVRNMLGMFNNAQLFNQPIASWVVSSVLSMEDMFSNTILFNQSLANWDVTSVLSMEDMFLNATAFDGLLTGWDTLSVETMASMFNGAGTFNQSVADFDTSSVETMFLMFNGATLFNQDISSFEISIVTDMSNILTGTAFDTTNYDLLLNAWVLQSRQTNVVFNTDACFTLAVSGASRTTIIATPWTVNDAGSCIVPLLDFIFDIDTEAVTPGVKTFTLPCGDIGTYNAVIDWGDAGPTSAITTFNDADLFHDYAVAGTYTITITGSLPHVRFNNGGDKLKMVDISQWGESAILSWESSYRGCSNMTITATDTPNSTAVLDMSFMFFSASLVNPLTTDWDVSNVTDMTLLFASASTANPDVLLWNVSSVQSFSQMFNLATAANPDVQDWNTISATNMSLMFKDCPIANPTVTNFTTDLVENMSGMFTNCVMATPIVTSWNTAACLDMSDMFFGCTLATPIVTSWSTGMVGDFSQMFTNAIAANPDVTSWDTSSATSYVSMFSGATIWNRDISGFNIEDLVINGATAMTTGSAFTTANYDLMLNGWAAQIIPIGSYIFSTDVCYTDSVSGVAHATLSALWTMQDAGACPAFVFDIDTEAVTPSVATFTLKCGNIGVYSATIDWGDGGATSQIDTFNDADLTHDYALTTGAGTYTVSITGSLPWVNFAFSGDREKMLDITEWGDVGALTFENSFQGCTNLVVTATDAPALVGLTDMSGMFSLSGISTTGNLNGWDVSTITNMSNLFNSAPLNQTLNSWDVGEVIDMSSMFGGTTAFNGNITSWLPNKVTNMNDMFSSCTVFNQDISGWTTSALTSMIQTFLNCPAFNSSLNTSGAIWDVSNVTAMNNLFNNCTAFNGNITGWDVSNVNNLLGAFTNCVAFNQNISGWQTDSLTDLRGTFQNTQLFDQNLSSWNVSLLTLAADMFDNGAGSIGLSIANYDNLLVGWAAQVVQTSVQLDVSSQYTIVTSQAARDILDPGESWTISDLGGI